MLLPKRDFLIVRQRAAKRDSGPESFCALLETDSLWLVLLVIGTIGPKQSLSRFAWKFDDREQIRAMFERYAPYRALASYAPEGVEDETNKEAKRPVLPWFRGDWALGGEPLVEGAELILHNKRFIEAAKAAFGTSCLNPEFVAVNINRPMPACTTHLDNPSFYGATRVDYPLPFLRVMGFSGLFDTWRVVQASAISWFYEGAGGSFDWPDGLDGPMLSERPPFGNVALISDNDQLYHRVATIGDPDAELPRISAEAQIQPDGHSKLVVLENGEVRGAYPCHAVRLSVLWKAEVRDTRNSTDNLTLDRIMGIFTSDLRHRSIDFTYLLIHWPTRRGSCSCKRFIRIQRRGRVHYRLTGNYWPSFLFADYATRTC